MQVVGVYCFCLFIISLPFFLTGPYILCEITSSPLFGGTILGPHPPMAQAGQSGDLFQEHDNVNVKTEFRDRKQLSHCREGSALRGLPPCLLPGPRATVPSGLS